MNSEHIATASQLLDLFRGRQDIVAVANGSAFGPQPLASPMKPEWLAQRHLGKERCLGFYLMTPESKVYCTCVDFDNKPEHPDPEWKQKTETVYLWLVKADLRPLVEISQSGNGTHVWLFFDEATDAWIARAFWRLVSEKTGVKFVEIYPKQDRLSGKGIGNLVRYPLWNLSRFTDPEDDWALLSPGKALGNVRKTSGAELQAMALEIGKALETGNIVDTSADVVLAASPAPSQGLPPRVQSRLQRKGCILERRWNGDTEGMKDSSTSALVLSIATELVRQFCTTPEIEGAVRYWCDEHEYEKANDRFVSRVVSKAYEFVHHRMEERSATVSTMEGCFNAYLDMLERGEMGYVQSGLPELDDSIDGVAFGEMAVIAARPSHGKSAFALQWLDSAAMNGLRCLLISEEMSGLELGKRAVTYVSPMPAEHWPSAIPLLRNDGVQHYRPRAPIYVVESCNSIDRVEDVVDQFVSLHSVRLVAIDYLQLLGGRGAKRYDQVTDVSRRLKQTARRNNIAMLALCQLNRDIERREDQEPQLHDLRETGQLEQDCDVAIFLVWPHRFDPLAHPQQYFIHIKKRRNGPIRKPKIETGFDADRQTIGRVQGVGVPIETPFDRKQAASGFN